MTTTELVISSIIIAFTVGVLLTVAAYEWSNRRMHYAMVKYRVEAINARAEADMMRQHRGTPYIHTTGPGLRVVGGQQMYSSDWLND